MKLYEVNTAIEDIVEQMVDTETGEILPLSDELMEQLHALEMERSRILEYLAKLVLNTRAEAAALKEEEQRLAKRRKRLEKKEAGLIEILDRECRGQKTDLGVATLKYTKSTRLDVFDAAKAIRWLKRNKYHECVRVKDPEVGKDEVKALIKSGIKVPGCQTVENVSCSLK